MAANASETSPPTTETAAAPEVALTPAATTPPPAPPHDDDESAPPPNAPIDPKVAQLAALFPATSNDIIEAVLAAVGGSLEQATETLLSMNDPSFAEPQQVRPFFWCAAGVADLTCASLNSTATPSLRAIWRHKTTTNGVSATPPHPPATPSLSPSSSPPQSEPPSLPFPPRPSTSSSKRRTTRKWLARARGPSRGGS